jgi:phosphoribosylformimino-5-aminoimidazole carboxamide ribotide isomerase
MLEKQAGFRLQKVNWRVKVRILPALDILKGECVRLYQGDYDQVTVYGRDPLEQAKRFEADGAKWLHIVDLDGAKTGKLVNFEIVKRIVENTGLKVQLGGGVRSLQAIRRLTQIGVEEVVIGTSAVKLKGFVRQAIERFGKDRIVVGVDARNGVVSSEGWTVESKVTVREFIAAMQKEGCERFILTDILRDGTLSEPNFGQLKELEEVVSLSNLTIAGGVSSIVDVEKLASLGVGGVIVGKALYEGRMTMNELVDCGVIPAQAGIQKQKT